MIEKQYNLISSTGFARPASMLVSISNNYLSKIVLEYEGNAVELNYSPESIVDVMSLGISPGALFYIKAEGVDELQVLESIDNHFNKWKLI